MPTSLTNLWSSTGTTAAWTRRSAPHALVDRCLRLSVMVRILPGCVRTHMLLQCVHTHINYWRFPLTRLLHISASPRGEASESLAIAGQFLDAVRDVRPSVEIQTFDLWDGTLPQFGPDAAGAKMSVFAGHEPTG